MGRHPERHGLKSSGRFIRNQRRLRQNDRQRARPETVHQFLRLFGNLTHQRKHVLFPPNVNDERVVGRASFCRIDLFGGGSVQRVSTEAVDRFRREGAEAARKQHFAAAPECLFQIFCFDDLRPDHFPSFPSVFFGENSAKKRPGITETSAVPRTIAPQMMMLCAASTAASW